MRHAGLIFLSIVLPSFILLSRPHANAQEPAKRIYIANDDHTDFMWTADAETYARVFVEMLDFHLKLADDTASNALPYRDRFNCDGSYWLWCYEQRKSPAEFAKLIARIKDGTISAPLNAVVSCYGGQPAEAVLRGMYYSGRLERKHDLRFPLAVAMENQTLPLGLTSLFAGSGAKYSWRGVCGCATKMDQKPFGERSQEILWWTGHDGQRLLLKWHSLVPPGNQQSGGYSEAFDPTAAVKFLDGDPAFLARYRGTNMNEPFRVRGAFGFGWDALDRKTGRPYLADPKAYPMVNHFHLIAKELSNDQRQVIVSNEVDFFEDFEKTHGGSLDSQSVTYGNEWDLYSASMSETSARVKRAVEKLRSAELLAALVSLKEPNFMLQHVQARDRAFANLGLYWEHNWTADGPISRAQRGAWQEQLASQIESYVNALQSAATDQLGAMIPKPADSNRFFVLNPLSWNRTEAADYAYTGPADIHVRDTVTEKDVPFQFIEIRGQMYLRILATDVPSAGYKVFEIQSGKGTAPNDDAALISGDGDSTIENESIKVVIERDGALRSLTDKANGNVELAANIGGLYLNDFAANSAEGSPLRAENRGPVSVTVVAQSNAGLDHSTSITLYRGSNRIDIHNELRENFSDVRHWTFSLAVEQPVVHTEEIGSINLNKLHSAGGDYADTHARYDHISVNHFADVTSGTGKLGVTISNPDLAFGRLGVSTFGKLDTSTPQIHMLAGGQVDGPNLGIPSQNGNKKFIQRFALQPHSGFDSASAMRFALEHQNPLIAGTIGGTKGDLYPAGSYSLLKVNDPRVLLWAIKVQEDGIERGLVARFWNLSNEANQANVFFTPSLKVAHRTTHIETDLEAIPLNSDQTLPTTFAREQIQTYRLELGQ